MKILLVNKFHYLRGGSESYYFGLDEMLRDHGHEVIHFAMQDEKNLPSPTSEFFIKNVDFNNTNGVKDKLSTIKNMFYSKEAYTKMKALLEKEHPDIVHLGLVHKQITYSILDAVTEYNIPIVQSVHDFIFICPNYMMLTNGHNCEKCVTGSKFNCVREKCIKGSAAKSALSYLENKYIAHKHYYDKIDLFLAECEFYKKLLEKGHFTKSKIDSLTNFLQPSKSIVKNTVEGEYFLFFGRFSAEKGILTLIEAYKKSKVETPLILVGGGPEDDKIRSFVKDNGLSNKVTFAGYVYGEKMVSLLDGAKAVLVPSEWYENCPYTILEAMARSRIVIASKIAGLPELVDDGVSGFLFKPQNSDDLAEKIKTVDQLPSEEAQKMNTATFGRAKCLFDPEVYYSKIIRIYENLIEGKKKA